MNDIFSRLPELLLPWYDENRRELPWRQDREPYHVWLSEIMLQQTRVEAVKGYYTKFLEALPTVADLANASEETLNKLWEGLGYYTRVRNLQKAAKQIMEIHGGRFPTSYNEIRALAGIGDYTAGAVCSICFDLPTPAVDGNVLRVCTRLTADPSPIDKPVVKKALTEALAAVYPTKSGTFTQALMELGATVCVPNGTPKCERCPLREICLAHKQGDETDFPVKSKKKPRKIREMTVLLLHDGERFALRKRPKTGLLAGLWEFPHLDGRRTVEEVLEQLEAQGLPVLEVEKTVEKTHIFTHIEWHMTGIFLTCRQGGDYTWGDPSDYALPTAFRIFLE
ncbi:MAG: A/G-specific adenine glycosylase [Oscillospiraceae bacterium]|nr:A/G-specific adenine glycosylase [Oscillospiraceae bacterium]